MAVNLQKGQSASLKQGNSGLSEVFVGLGWDINQYRYGADFDLDAFAFLCQSNGKVADQDDDFVYFGNLSHSSGAVEHTGDNLTGEGEGDDEVIRVDLDALPSNIQKVSFGVIIYDAEERGQNFGQVQNAYIRVLDANTGRELVRYNLRENFSTETAVLVGEIYQNYGEWNFRAVGRGFNGGAEALCEYFDVDF